jgi:hypothetical protein
MELGILTPEQGVQTIKTGLYPETHDLVTKQEAYIEERQKGFYTPLVGGQPLMPDMDDEGDKGQPSNTNQPEDKTPTVQDVVDDERIEPGAGPVTIGRPRKVKQERGRPSGSNKRDSMKLTTKAVQDVVYEIESLFTFAQQQMKSSHNIKRLSKDKKALLDELCKTIVISTPKENWESKASSCIKDFSGIEGLGPMPEILEASQEHQLEIYPAALVYHAQEKDSQSTKDGVKK